MTELGHASFLGLFGHIRCCVSFSFKLDPFIEQSETLEKMGAERPGVLVLLKSNVSNDDIALQIPAAAYHVHLPPNINSKYSQITDFSLAGGCEHFHE